MAAPLPLPRVGLRGRADQRDVVVVHAEPAAVALLREERVIGRPFGANSIVALRAQGGLHDREPGRLRLLAEIAPAETFALESGRREIGPALFLRGIAPIEQPSLLFAVAEDADKCFRGADDVGGRVDVAGVASCASASVPRRANSPAIASPVPRAALRAINCRRSSRRPAASKGRAGISRRWFTEFLRSSCEPRPVAFSGRPVHGSYRE